MDTSLCKLPRNTLLDIDFSTWLRPSEDSFYLLYLNGEIFVVQGPHGATYVDKDGLITKNEGIRGRHLKTMLQQMKTLQTKRYKWFLLDQDEKTKEYRILPRRQSWTMYKIKAPLWLRKVQESELQLLRWVGSGRCVCLLDDVQVDVDIAWDPLTFKKMEQIMIAVRELSELDLCYKPVAHILRGDDVIGIAFEKQSGRPIQFKDRRLFYDSMAQLHDRSRPRRLYLRYPYCTDHLIQDGKLRVYHHLWGFDVYKGPNTKMEDAVEERCWEKIGRIFQDLKEAHNPGENTYDNGEPMLFQYAQWNAEHPVRNPVVGITIDASLLGGQEDSPLPLAQTEGAVRRTRLLLADEEKSLTDTVPIVHFSATTRKASSLISSQSPSKRYRPSPPAIPSEGRIVEIKDDDTETIASGDDDDETLVDEDGSIDGRYYSSVSTMRSISTFATFN